MTGRHVLILVLALSGFAGARHAVAQGDPFEQAKCEEEFVSLRGAVESRGKAVEGAGKRHAGAPEMCKLLRAFTTAESRMVKFLQDRQATCGIPEQIIKQAAEGHSRTVAMRNQVCQAAAGPAAPPPPPPSQGLSGALGTRAIGGAPAEAAGGSGVFDTLTGNVLRQ